MTQNISVQYFPPKQGSTDKDLGGGYVTSGIIKTSFRVIKTDKNDVGYFISLPRKQNESQQWVDVVSFVNKEAQETLIRLVQEKMNPDSNPPATAPAQAPSSKTGQRQVPPKTPSNGVPGKVPW
ncbi:hypothetical protein KAZ66_00315 [Candidatus Woesebacteria bacterium]|nr:hypothetical protein [Candidatus Woesebacteria bacterium]